MSLDYIQSYNVHPHKIVNYSQYIGSRCKRRSHAKSLLNLQDNNHRGRVSRQARNKITNYINIILAQATNKKYWSEMDKQYFKFRINFITLTLPSTQVHTDQEIKSKCLGQFLSELRRKFPQVKYFWRAEKQGNGNIHFHLLTDVFYHWRDIRSSWNRIVNKLGYVDRFATIHGYSDPNSTDVHAIKNIKNIGAYLAKYCTKENQSSGLSGRQYGASQNVINLCKVQLTEADFNVKEFEDIAKVEGIVCQSNEYMVVLYGNIDKLLKKRDSRLGELYREMLRKLQESG